MRWASVCSGIGAPECAWRDLWGAPAYVSEIAPFARAVLKHYYPEVPNRGDFTQIEGCSGIELLVGGTPCQDFSVAGLRAGLAGERGNLTLEFLRLLGRERPRWVVWENVPGVLSADGGRAFGAFLGELEQLGYGWAYRTLDAQYAGVPQRRRRVFVVGYLGDWRPPAAVLFERHSLSGHSPPSREAGEGATAVVAHSLKARGNNGSVERSDLNVVEIAHSLRGEGFDASEDGTGRGTPLVPVAFDTTQITSPLYRSTPQPNGPCHTLAKSAHPPAISFAWQSGGDCRLDTREDQASGLQASQTLAVIAFQSNYSNQAMNGERRTLTVNAPTVIAFTDRGRDGGRNIECQESIAYALKVGSGGGAATARQVVTPLMDVRRLTPRECERLQGFSDDWTAITYRKKPAQDGPRYQALGNSMAVPVVRWIGERIALVAAISDAAA